MKYLLLSVFALLALTMCQTDLTGPIEGDPIPLRYTINPGSFEFSASVIGDTIMYNTASNGRKGCFGEQGFDDYDNVLKYNIFENFAWRINTLSGHPNPDDISENTFINVPE